MIATTTKIQFGPASHGRRVSDEAAEAAEYVEGYKYEIIGGRLYVSPLPNSPENYLENWLEKSLDRYSDTYPEVIDYVTTKARVFLPNRRQTTVPEPDIAAYANYPHDTPVDKMNWQTVSPILVAEVLVEGEFQKDLARNPRLFLAVPSIQEYWVLDGSVRSSEPTLIQHVRRGRRWDVITHPFGSTFTTPLLPDFKLVLNPRRRRTR